MNALELLKKAAGGAGKSRRRTYTIRAVVAVVYVVLAVLMFVTGRSHTVLIDNRAAEDGSYKAINGMALSVNHGKSADYMKGDRDLVTVKGQTVRLKVQSFDGKIDDVYTLKIPLKEDSVIISVPKLAYGIDGAMAPFDLSK